METNHTLRELLDFFKGQRIHRIDLHYQDFDGKYKQNNIEKIDIDWCNNSNLVFACDRFKYDSWFLHLTLDSGANYYYSWEVDKWWLISDPNCKTREGYETEEYEDDIEHDYVCLDIWIKRPVD